jgi:hypothetical protein
MEESSKDKLTDEELQQLSALIDWTETLESTAQKLGLSRGCKK